MRRRCGTAIGLTVLVVSACGDGARRARDEQLVRSAIAQSETTAARVAAAPSSGLWTEDALIERLVRAGVAPRAAAGTPTGLEWMRAKPLVLLAGGGEVLAWVYADSVARRAVTDALDSNTAAPPGSVAPFAGPIRFVTQNNLAAVVSGGSERNQERIALALQAGVPVARVP